MRFCRSVYRRGRIWWGKYRVPGGPLVRCSLGTDDKQAAEARLLGIYREAEQETLGMIPPRLMRESSVRPLAEHLRDYLADLETLGRDEKHLSVSSTRLKKLLISCKWSLLRDVSPDSFLRWRSRQRKLSGKTLNHYLAHAQAFLGWLVDCGRAGGNPLARVQKVDTRGRETVVRRAYNVEDLRRLCAIPGRGLVYRFAVFTGMRRAEIKALMWSQLVLEGEAPRVLVRASTAKNRKNTALPLHPDLLGHLREHRAACADLSGFVFRPFPKTETLNRDLARLGIPKTDAEGRKVDFHALRGTFATLLNLHGATPRAAMDLMRHSDMRLTHQVYTDATAIPLLAEVSKLPGI